ncbi:MAG: MBL fold metallo-hydrolase, partial [Gemmatimonadota bacterium]
GPAGTKEMMTHLAEAYAFDIGIRKSDDRAAPEGVVIHAEDIAEGVVFEKDGVTITAFEVDHSPVRPAFGYRIDYQGHSVVLSGDTRVSENLIRHAQGVDLLVHEVVAPETMLRSGRNPERAKAVIAHHTTAEQAGGVFARTKPRLAVYSHVGQPDATEADLVPPTRKSWSGRLEVGEDLMVIDVGDSVEVHQPAGGPH